jgi:adenine-specific DNA-methyltransferase
MGRYDMDGIEQQWASRLGLATNPLFGAADRPQYGQHTAMVDGVAGSFALSTDFDATDRDIELSGWAWSSLLRHHVTLEDQYVLVRSAASRVTPEVFTRHSVERNLDGFLRFLESRAESPRVDVAEHVISVFRKHCQWLGPQQHGTGAMFLSLIAVGLEYGIDHIPDAARIIATIREKYHLSNASIDAVTEANPDYLRRFADELSFCVPEAQQLNLDLAVRHANGPIFQEAHAFASTTPSLQGSLFGLGNDTPAVAAYGKGAYFTPQGLARSVADYVLPRVMFRSQRRIAIADVACGSGVFLAEAIRTLARNGFAGTVKLIGIDISADAVDMAKFNTACTVRDLDSAILTVETEFRCCDFLETSIDWGEIDAVVMNPPFISWEAMSGAQQDTLRRILGQSYKGRMDYSTAFVERVVDNLKPSAWVASLLPVGAIAGAHGEKWRRHLIERAQPTMVGSLGDHSLFRGAMVNPAIIVLQKRPAAEGQVALLWSSERRDAASAGLRQLRKGSTVASVPVARSGDWALYPVDQKEFSLRTNWLPTPSATGALLSDLRLSTPTTVSDLFAIKQGVRTGLRDAFIIDANVWHALPENERRHFRPVADSRHIAGGQITSDSYILWPDVDCSGTAEEIRNLVPQFYATVFSQYIDKLRARKGVSPETPGKLTWERTWLKTASPRIVSKMFARSFGFAPDLDGKYVIVQGLAWQPKARVVQSFGSDRQSLRDALVLYTSLLNSEVFYRLIQDFTTNVAGGQLDLSAKFLSNVPLPDLGTRLQESRELNERATKLLRMSASDTNYDYVTASNEFAALAYRTTLSQWLSN